MNPIVHELFQRARLLSTDLNKALKKHGLFSSQWSVIYVIHQHGEMTLTQIWKYLNVEAPTITRTVNRLEQMEWLETREGQDRREKNVSLTESAIAQLPDILKTIIQFEKDSFNGLSAEEEELLMELLRKIGKGA